MLSARDNNAAVADPFAAALEGLGLSIEEAQVYLACLKLGARPAGLIAREAGLKRGHTYNLLSALAAKALVQDFLKNNVRQFVANPPRALLTLLDLEAQELARRKERVAAVLPELERFGAKIPSSAKVRFFRGVEGIKSIYEDTLSEPGEIIYALSDFENTFPPRKNAALNRWIWSYATRRAKRGIWYHGILCRSPLSDLAYRRRREQKRKLKMLEGVALPVEINVYGNKVAMASTVEDMSGVIIEDRLTAETLRNFHQAVWPLLRDYRI